jgi:hypothetical protein
MSRRAKVAAFAAIILLEGFITGIVVITVHGWTPQ